MRNHTILLLGMMNGHSNLYSYAEQLELFKKTDTARDVFIQELIRNYEELQLKATRIIAMA